MPEIRVVVSDELDRYMDTVIQKGMFGSKAELIRAALIRYVETLPIRVPSGYDDTTVFSPDGRIFQVEYALECAYRGSIILGMRYHDGVMLAKQKSVPENFITGPYEDFKIDQHIGATVSGIGSDFIVLKDKAMKEAQMHKKEFGEPIGVEELVKILAIFIQSYTMKKDVRPLGCIVFIGGVDQTGRHLFMVDPSGSYGEVIYTVTGYQSAESEKILKDNYKPDMPLQEALGLVIKAVLKEETRKPEEISVAVIETETKTLRKIALGEIEEAWKVAFKKKQG